MGRPAKRQYYICIFYKHIYPKRCTIVYTTDCDKKLVKTNATAKNSLYVCYCQYKVVESGSKSKYMKYIYEMYPTVVSPYESNKYILNLSPEDAYHALEAYAKDTNSLFNIRLIDTNVSTNNKKISESTDKGMIDSSSFKEPSENLSNDNDEIKATDKETRIEKYPIVTLFDNLDKNLVLKIAQDEKLILKYRILYPEDLYFEKLDSTQQHYFISITRRSILNGFSLALNDTNNREINIFNIPPKSIDCRKLHKQGDTFLMKILNGYPYIDMLSNYSTISLENFYIGSIKYKQEVADAKMVDRNHLENYNTRTISIVDYWDIDLYNPLAVKINGNWTNVYDYIDFLDASLNAYCEKDPVQFIKILRDECSKESLIRKNISPNPDRFLEAHRIKDLDVYFEGKITDKTAHYISRFLFDKFDIEPSDFQILLMRRFRINIVEKENACNDFSSIGGI